MKKIRAKTEFKHAVSKGSFMQELLEIMGRLSIKMDDDKLEVMDVQDECLAEVIDLIDDYSWISEIHICDKDDSFEETLAESSEMLIEQSEDEAVEEDASSNQAETAEDMLTVENNRAESNGNAVANKVMFENKVIEGDLNRLLKTISWAINFKYASIDDIRSILFSSIRIMSMKYNPRYPECSVGDIVVVDYGHNLYNETSGSYVHGIVCDIPDEHRILVIPIGKIHKKSSQWHIPFSAPQDATYFVTGYNEGIAIIDQARYINRERINKNATKPIVGKISPEFLSNLLDMLPKAFTFDNRMPIEDNVANCTDDDAESNDTQQDQSEDNGISKESAPTVYENEPEDAYDAPEDIGEDVSVSAVSDDVVQDTIDDTVIEDTEVSSCETVQTVIEPEKATKPISKLTYEEAINEIIGEALEEVDSLGAMTDEVRQFIANIGMDTTDGYLVQAFIKACEMDRITMANVAGAICVMAGIKKKDIVDSLKQSFKQWIEKYPEFKAKFPKISLTVILKAFANKKNAVE